MQDRITRRLVNFLRPFSLAGQGEQPAGVYAVETVEAPIDSMSFLVYRRISTTIELRSGFSAMMSRQLVEIDPLDLEAAEARDAVLQAAAGASSARLEA